MNKFLLLKNNIQQVINRNNQTNLIFVRHGQTNSNLSNSLAGWTDSRLTIRGREQANELMQAIYPFREQFQSVYSSDLKRSLETAQISLGFPKNELIHQDRRLRELYFGEHENLAYSMLDQNTKDIIFTLEYQAPNGESWLQVRQRMMQFIQQTCIQNGTYLIYSHGGAICTITYELGLKDSINNCSCVSIHYDKQNNKLQDLLFKWDFPSEEEEKEI